MSKKKKQSSPGSPDESSTGQQALNLDGLTEGNVDNKPSANQPSTTDTANFAEILGDDWKKQFEAHKREPGINDTVSNMPAVLGSETAPAPSAGGGGDTLRMPSIKPGSGPARDEPATLPPISAPPPGGGKHMPAGARRRLLREQSRVTTLPRRRGRRHLGFFSWLFGFFGLIFRMALVTVLVMALTGFLGYHAIRAYIMTPEVDVPNIRGTRVENAIDVLSEKGLSLVKDRSEPSGMVAPGEIIDQRPLPGSRTKRGATVRVVTSSGNARFVVPDVLGETKDNAVNKIRGANLEVGDITYIESGTHPRDAVITQNPEPNKALDASARVNLLVSSGPPGSRASMPDLVGRSLADARAELNRIGVTNITIEPAGATTGQVISHSPVVGSSILQDQAVTLNLGQ